MKGPPYLGGGDLQDAVDAQVVDDVASMKGRPLMNGDVIFNRYPDPEDPPR